MKVGRKVPPNPFKEKPQPQAPGRIAALNKRRAKAGLPPLRVYEGKRVTELSIDTRYNKDASYLATRSLDDIFHYLPDLRMPKTVYVLGAGPYLLGDIQRIPSNAFIIATNRTIDLIRSYDKDFPIAMWMVFDKAALHYDWFTQAIPHKKCLTVFGIGLSKTQKLFKVDYTFRSRGIIQNRKGLNHLDTIQLIQGGIQGNGTITYCAVQLCFWAGCKKVILAGCSMQGRDHFDGTRIRNAKKGAWRQVRYWRKGLPQMERRGMDVYSLSPTAIPVKAVLNT